MKQDSSKLKVIVKEASVELTLDIRKFLSSEKNEQDDDGVVVERSKNFTKFALQKDNSWDLSLPNLNSELVTRDLLQQGLKARGFPPPTPPFPLLANFPRRLPFPFDEGEPLSLSLSPFLNVVVFTYLLACPNRHVKWYLLSLIWDQPSLSLSLCAFSVSIYTLSNFLSLSLFLPLSSSLLQLCYKTISISISLCPFREDFQDPTPSRSKKKSTPDQFSIFYLLFIFCRIFKQKSFFWTPKPISRFQSSHFLKLKNCPSLKNFSFISSRQK